MVRVGILVSRSEDICALDTKALDSSRALSVAGMIASLSVSNETSTVLIDVLGKSHALSVAGTSVSVPKSDGTSILDKKFCC